MANFIHTVTINGKTRDVEFAPRVNGDPNAFDSVTCVGLVRKGNGTKLWPTRIALVKRGETLVLKTSGYYVLNSSAGYLVAWNDAEFAANLSQHNSASH